MPRLEGAPPVSQGHTGPVRGRRAALVHAALLAAFSVAVCEGQSPPRRIATEAAGNQPAATASGTPAAPQQGAARLLQSRINPTGYTSARVCGGCHVDIYNSWKNSLHAFSLSDPVFDTAYMQALKEAGDEAKRLCLRCHAPLTQANNDWDLREEVTREGVSCDFCHTVTAVHLDQPEKPYVVEPGLVKRSVLRQASSPVHQVAYSRLHETAEFCGGCHNLAHANGAAIMGTYDEWRDGPYAAEGVPCQSCHMVRNDGQAVSEAVRSPSTAGVHLHDLIHDTDQLRSAVTVEITRAKRSGNALLVDVVVANVGSGHMVPTGIPSRALALKVTVRAEGRDVSQERRYRKVLADKDGQVLTRDFEVLLRATAVVADNRIGPRERRLERFNFPVPETGSVKVTAAVSYVYSPLVLDQREINIELARSEKPAS